MFLNNENDIINWLMTYCDFNLLEIDEFIYFTQDENNQIITNSKSSLELCIPLFENLPIKFGTIDGNFDISKGNNLNSFNGFPTIIKGSLNANDTSFTSTNDWNVKEVYGSINLCGPKCELDNLDFLENTKFEKFILKINHTPFLNDIIPNKKLIDNNDLFTLERFYTSILYNDYFKLLNLLNNFDKDLDDYLESFNNESIKELK